MRAFAASLAQRDPTGRFSDRVDDYVRFRPGYPPSLIDFLRGNGWIREGSVVADIGAGTGISSALFLEAGCRVEAVEPNAPMRAAAVARLGGDAGFHAVDGRAEATTLADASIDLVAAGTAFHWFEPDATRTEVRRILRGNGGVALFWNLRDAEAPLMRDYEALLRTHCAGYAESDAGKRADLRSIETFFGSGTLASVSFPNRQSLDFEGLVGRVLSSSYAPRKGYPGHAPLLEAMRGMFDRSAIDGAVTLVYATRLYVGRPG